MKAMDLFLVRYNILYDTWLKAIWEQVPEELMRQRPHPRVNSVVWNLWHMARVEDVGLNRFIADRPQVMDSGNWLEKMGIPYRHNGYDMTLDEVDEFSQQINLQALREYSLALKANTLEITASLELATLEETLTHDRVEQVVVGEGWANPRAQGMVENYTGWSKAQCLMNLGLTHSFHHIGEINVIISLMELED